MMRPSPKRATQTEFALFALNRHRAGGIAYGLTSNVWLRPTNIERDLIRSTGEEVPGERTLTYFIVHEIVHGMLSKHIGRWRYLQLPTWLNEGYADFVAKDGRFDFAATHKRYVEGAPELDPERSRLYLRYQLMVSYWLEIRGLSVEQLLRLPPDTVTPLGLGGAPVR
jgi:hypothetical protein